MLPNITSAGGSIYNSPFISSVPPGISPTAAQTDPNLHWARAIAMTNPVIIIGTCSQERIMILTIQMPRSSLMMSFLNWGIPVMVTTCLPAGSWRAFSPTAVIPNMIPLLILLMSTRLLSSVASKKLSPTIISLRVTGVCYALRFKQGTGNPIDDSSLSDFPLATDNNMVCAYRYTRVGSFANHDFTSLLKVDCVYLGSAFTGNISTINNDSWWDSHTSEAVVRIFPAAGYISFPTFISSGLLEARGEYGRYWSSTEFPSLLGNAWNVSFYSYSAFANYRDVKHHGFSVRLFADK